MRTRSQIESDKRVEKVNAAVTSSSKEGSQVKFSDTIAVKLIEHMAKIRDEVVQGVTGRFPIKGLEMIVRQVFDSALEKSIDTLLNILDPELKHSPLGNDTSKLAHSSASNQSQNLETHDEVHSQTKINKRKKAGHSETVLKPPEDTHDTKICIKKDEKIDARVVEDHQKRLDKLMLEIKVRDKKILDQKKDIEKLQNALKLSENQANSPFISRPTPDPEEESQIQNQMKSLMEFMRRITPILNKDPKYKIMFFLKRVGKSVISKLSEDLGIPLKKLNRVLKELESMKIIRREEDTVFLMDVH
nr:hypothetical protein [Candidatus Freyarchaeota archaeon]